MPSNLPPGVTDKMIEDQVGSDPSPLQEAVLQLLEDKGVGQETCDKICALLEAWENEEACSSAERFTERDR